MNIENLKGCVYFFKHIGMSPIKIGFTLHSSPMVRFLQFKTYAPFGAQLVGFIKTSEPKNLETLLHNKFSSFRIKGEWFEISEELALKTIDFYSNIEDVEDRNKFQIEWAKKCMPIADININDIEPIMLNSFTIKDIGNTKVLNLKEVMSIIEEKNSARFNKQEVKSVFNQWGLRYTTHRISPVKNKKGWKINVI